MTSAPPEELTTKSTLSEAIRWLMARIDEGEMCPCCGQRAQKYRRSIGAGMARALIEQYKKHGQDNVHTRNVWLPFTKEGAQLQWWGLIEPTMTDDGIRSGWWHITEKGRKFVEGKVSVPKWAYVYNGNLLEVSGEEVFITECLGKRFDFIELMTGHSR